MGGAERAPSSCVEAHTGLLSPAAQEWVARSVDWVSVPPQALLSGLHPAPRRPPRPRRDMRPGAHAYGPAAERSEPTQSALGHALGSEWETSFQARLPPRHLPQQRSHQSARQCAPQSQYGSLRLCWAPPLGRAPPQPHG
eukprot:scaffold26160_cov39-Tisochrysis_lutea.AAC.1